MRSLLNIQLANNSYKKVLLLEFRHSLATRNRVQNLSASNICISQLLNNPPTYF